MIANAANIEARANPIQMMISNTENPKARNSIIIKSFVNARNRTGQTHCPATLVRPTKLTINVRDTIRRRATRKRTLSNYTQS